MPSIHRTEGRQSCAEHRGVQRHHGGVQNNDRERKTRRPVLLDELHIDGVYGLLVHERGER